MNPNLIIKEHTETSFQIGKKIVHKDANGNWLALSELTANQKAAVEEHLLNKGETINL